MRQTSSPVTLRLAVALAGVMAMFVLIEQVPELQRLLEPVNLGLALATELALRHLEIPVARHGTVLAHPDGFSYRIAYECSGFRPAALIAATLLTVPAGWPARVSGLCVAAAGIAMLNLCRLVHLYRTGIVDPDGFFVAHRVTWNIVAVIAVIVFVTVWLCVTNRPGREQPLPESHAMQ